eukprot:RCo011576
MEPAPRLKNAAVVVIGEMARSPRMMYHALSLADQAGFQVYLVGHKGRKLYSAVEKHPHISQELLFTPVSFGTFRRRSFVFASVVRVLLELFQLALLLLWRLPRCEVMVVQTPPGVPVLAVAQLACLLRNIHLVVDWHNLGYTLLQADRRPWVIVEGYRQCERLFGRGASANFCVSEAMQRWLHSEWNIGATVLHDCPAAVFREYPPEAIHALLTGPSREALLPPELSNPGPAASHTTTPLTNVLPDGKVRVVELVPGPEAVALVVSSTSWTPDEDFGVLLDAFQIYDRETVVRPTELPRLWAVITGDGPLRGFYEEQIAGLGLRRTFIRTAFLRDLQDYAILLASAHLGLSLHTSSSGIDLPMKVVDMFG